MDLKTLLPQPPRKRDVLVAEDKTRHQMSAIVQPWRGDRPYREGYRRAGRILTAHVSKHGGASYLVFPICHSYRHFVELMLKGLIALGCIIVHRDMTPAEEKLRSKSHRLWDLWNAFSTVEREVTAARDQDPRPLEDIQGIEAYIKQLDAIDPGSDHFRYPVTTKGEFTLQGIDQINVGHFGEYMERLCDYLEAFDTYYTHLFETDMDSEDWQ
jgi:hypothetical protein